MATIPVSIINLKERSDRLQHILDQFKFRTEFDFTILSSNRITDGRLGLWNNLLKTVNKAKKLKMPFIIFCEDDHLFTSSYSYKNLLISIQDGERYGGDLLLGGVSWFDNALQINKKLFYVSKFTGLQFAIIYSRFYDTILDAEFGPIDVADIKLSELSCKKLVIHPFISIQKEFGYSDITIKNNKAGYVRKLFKSSSTTFSRLKKVKRFYNGFSEINSTASEDFSEISIPTFIINHFVEPCIVDGIKLKFSDKKEFDITITHCNRNKIEKEEIWEHLQNIVQTAINNEDDVIIVSHGVPTFSRDYNRFSLIKNIIDSHEMGAQLLLLNAFNIDQIVPVTNERYWFNQVENSTFYVIYKGLFQKILGYSFKKGDEIFKIFSMLSGHKMILYPFLVKDLNLNTPKTLTMDEKRLEIIKAAMIEMNNFNYSGRDIKL